MLARPMRRAVVLLSVVALAAGIGGWAAGWFGGAAMPPPPGTDSPAATTPVDGAAAAARGEDAARAPARTPAALPAAAPAPTDPLADRPTACLRVLDRDSKQPLAGAPIYRCKDGSAIAFTDVRGLAPVPLPGPEQLAVIAPDHLARMAPTRPGSSEAEPFDVLLARDAWSLPRTMQLDGVDGAPVPEARVRVQPVVARRHIVNPVPQADAAGQRAWVEACNVARLGLPSDFVVAAGALPPSTVHTVRTGQTLRFEADGEYALVAATTDGRVARARVRVDAGARTAPPIVLAFAPGARLRGRVVDSTGAPLAGAKVTARADLPTGTTAITDANGAFTLPTLLAGEPVALHVRHGLCQPADVAALVPPRDDVVVTLTPLPQQPLRGRVRTRPSLQPLAGAAVVWQPEGFDSIAATTDAAGTFSLAATGKLPARLSISASGHIAYAEVVAPGAPFADYDLWPATADARVTAGVSALLEGVTLDAAGAPIGDIEVAWAPATEASPPLPAGRRILAGGALALPRSVRSAADGSFRLETIAFGPGRLYVVGARERGLDATAIAGKAQNGFRVPR